MLAFAVACSLCQQVHSTAASTKAAVHTRTPLSNHRLEVWLGFIECLWRPRHLLLVQVSVYIC